MALSDLVEELVGRSLGKANGKGFVLDVSNKCGAGAEGRGKGN
jgi:hypothetical protein